MPGTMSLSTYQKQNRHQATVEHLDQQLHPYGLHFLLSLPDHKSILTNTSKDLGINFGIRDARKTLTALQNGTLTTKHVLRYILKIGFKILK